MSDTSELDALIVRNICDLEAALIQAKKLDERLLEAVGEVIRDHLAAADWFIHSDAEDADIWLARRAWLVAHSDPTEADYRLDVDELLGPDGSTDETWLAEFLGNGPSGASIGLFLTGATLDTKRKRKALLKAQGDVAARLVANGFRHDGENLWVPIRLDTEALATAFDGGDLADALQPVRDALNIIVTATDDIEALIVHNRAIS